MSFDLNIINFNLTSFFNATNMTENNVNAYISAGNFTNPSDLSIATSYLQGKLNSINADLDPNNPTSKQSILNGVVSNLAINNSELARVQGLVNVANSDLSSKTTQLNSVLGNINTKNIELASVQDLISIKNQELNSKQSTLNGILGNINTKNIELEDVQNLINVANSDLSSKTTQLNSVLGQISQYTDQFRQVENNLTNIESQLDARTEELSNRLQQEGVSLSTIKTTLNNFKTAQAALNGVLANPTVNLYASGTKKIIPLKKRIKLFLTLNGKEQWAAPPTVQFISISALVSSTLKQGTNNPKYSRAGRWRDITKSLKPKLAREAGRYYIELDARGVADFPADYFDEFVIRYDNPAQWSGEVLRWSWGVGATVGSGAGLVQTAQQLTTSMEQIVDILDELLGEGGSTGSTILQNLPNFGNLPQL